MTRRPATPAQRSFIEALMRDRDLTGTAYEGHVPDWSRAEFHNASQMITYLKTLPCRPAAQAEPGYYVKGSEAFKVQANKAGTSTYALQWSGSSWEYAPGMGRHLADMVPMTAEDAARLGLASGRCIHYCRALGGETLTARVAALVGYGETCASNNGWAFPRGAAAQREYLSVSA